MTTRELRVINTFRKKINNQEPFFLNSKEGLDIYKQAHSISKSYNDLPDNKRAQYLSPSELYASVLIYNFYQEMVSKYLKEQDPSFFSRFVRTSNNQKDCQKTLDFYDENFPTLNPNRLEIIEELKKEESSREFFIHKVMLENIAICKAINPLINDPNLKFPKSINSVSMLLGAYDQNKETLFDILTSPSKAYPRSLEKQIEYILEHWKDLLSKDLLLMLKKGLSAIKEENENRFNGPFVKSDNFQEVDYTNSYNEYEAFTIDKDWMPNVVMMAKSTLVWLDQLTKKYNRPITQLDQIPDQELDDLQNRGFTALWLIGLWQRSEASKRIKHLCGNNEAEASAYSLYANEISTKIGGWPALYNLKQRCQERNIRLASDMVPNHTGIDSTWIHNHPEYFIQQSWPPFPSYTFNGEDLSTNPNIEIKIEDHYYNQSDAAVAFKRYDKRTGETSYIFHGNDGTSMPWNDTAQLDYLRKETRDAVIKEIFGVARNFPIIRFDAAMTLAKKHIQRLWYPLLGNGAEIAGRSQYALSQKEFDRLLPIEFWIGEN